MVTRIMLGPRRSWAGRTGRFRRARTGLALPWHVRWRSSTPSDPEAVESRDPAMQQRALRHRFWMVLSNSLCGRREVLLIPHGSVHTSLTR